MDTAMNISDEALSIEADETCDTGTSKSRLLRRRDSAYYRERFELLLDRVLAQDICRTTSAIGRKR